MSSLYIGHGAPLNAIWDTEYRQSLEKFARNYEKPNTIVVVSAHFERHLPLQITSSNSPQIIYDYYGFPDELYELEYKVSGNPKLAKKIAKLLSDSGRNPYLNPNQGLDHGAWIPLSLMYPEADIPVLQLSIPIPRTPDELFKIGEILSPLRDDGVTFMGSGNLVHNLRHAFSKMSSYGVGIEGFRSMPIETWAKDFDKALKENLDDLNLDVLLNSSSKLHNFNAAAPTTEHFDPLYFVLGTLAQNEAISYIHEGFEGGSISMRSFVGEY